MFQRFDVAAAGFYIVTSTQHRHHTRDTLSFED